MGSLQKRWVCRTAAHIAAATAALLLLTAVPAGARDRLTPHDLEAGFDELEALGGFFGAFAARETDSFAQERWRRLSRGYPGTAEILRRLLLREQLRLDDLPPGRVSGLLERGVIVVDSDLDGRWAGRLPADDAETAARRRDLLLPALVEALARRQPPQDWPWLADHLREVGGFGALAQDPVARPLLARFFLAKDSYLRLALQRIGEGDPAARRALAGRQAAAGAVVRSLAVDLAATFGPEPAARLEADWTDYVASVDGFAVTRGWLLLDPALRQTRLGAAVRREADAVRQAAAEVVAEAPQPQLPEVAAPPQAPAASAEVEVAALQSELDTMASAVEAGEAEAGRLAAALAAEREARAAAERQIAEQLAAAEAARQQAAAEAARQQAAAEAAKQQAEAEAARQQAAPQIAVIPPSVAAEDGARVTPGDRRQLSILAAVAAGVLIVILLALLLWRRRLPPSAEAAPLLLSAPAAAGFAPKVAESGEMVPQAATPQAAAPPPAAAEPAATLPRTAAQPGQPLRVNGVTPPTASARAAMKAGAAMHAASQAVQAPLAEDAGREADTAANPIVQALRKGNLPLFELLFGELTDLRAPQLQRIVYGGRGEDLAIVCRAVGVDKLLFGSIFLLTDHLRGGSAEEEPERTAGILSVYERLPPATARKVLAKWQSTWSSGRRAEPLADG